VQPYSPAFAAVVRDPTDVIGRRIAALVIDWGIAFAMIVVLALSLAQTRDYPTAGRAEDACNRINDDTSTDEVCVPIDDTVYVYDGGDMAAIILLPLAYHFLNDALFTGITGFSIGKGLVGLRVIRASDGRLCGVGRAMLRWLLWVADGAPYCLPIVALVTGLTTKGHRRVGDMAAGTLVVDKRDVGVVPVVPGLNAVTPPPWGATAWGAPVPTWGPPAQSYPPQSYPPQSYPPAQSYPPPSSPPPAAPAPPAWGQPAAPPSWTPTPSTPPSPPPPPPAPGPSNPGVDSPLWDDARDTYIQWDPDLATWVQWDDATKQWHPIV
jgi:RDD family protein